MKHRVGLRVGGWRLWGNLHLAREAEPEAAMMILGVKGDTFLPLTEAHAVHAGAAMVRLGPVTAIVQRDKIDAIWSVGVPEEGRSG
jgi:hypothetical protein